MDWRVFFITFASVFVAELADKTQLVGIAMSSKTGKPVSVWFGSVFAYMFVTVLSVLIGLAIGKFIKPEFIRYIGASLFIIIGALIFLKLI